MGQSAFAAKGEVVETKRTFEMSDPRFTLSDRALAIERLVGGLCSLLPAVGVGVLSLIAFRSQPVFLAVGLVAAAAMVALAVWQIALFFVLKRYGYSLVVTPKELILREKQAYHYIRYADLRRVKVSCTHFEYEFSGGGYERLDFLDGEIYYFIGEIKKRFATREAEKIARLVCSFLGE